MKMCQKSSAELHGVFFFSFEPFFESALPSTPGMGGGWSLSA